MHNHAEGTDPFDDFARRDLEEKGVEPKKAREVVEETYNEPERPPLEDREAGNCRFCGQRVIDGAPEAGGDQSRPYWMTDPRHATDGIGGDYGCDPSPETHPDEGVGSHAVTEEEVQRAEEWAAVNAHDELVATAGALIEDAADGGILEGDPEEPVPVPRYKLQALRAALAKARGES